MGHDGVGGIILAGGKSKRMGREKPLLDFGGRPLISWVVEAMEKVVSSLVIVTNKPDLYMWLNQEKTSDILKGVGPLGGIHAGLKHLKVPRAVVVGADMPFLQWEALDKLIQLSDDQTDMVIPYWRDLPEHLHAIYSYNCLPHIEACIASDNWRISCLKERVNHQKVPAEALTTAPEDVFFNVNTVEDYQRARVHFLNKGILPKSQMAN